LSFIFETEPFLVINESVKGREILFFVHNASDTGFRWDPDPGEWVQLSETGGIHILNYLFKGEVDYDRVDSDRAETQFPGSLDKLPSFEGLTWGPE
jgi:hypothetical protein